MKKVKETKRIRRKSKQKKEEIPLKTDLSFEELVKKVLKQKK